MTELPYPGSLRQPVSDSYKFKNLEGLCKSSDILNQVGVVKAREALIRHLIKRFPEIAKGKHKAKRLREEALRFLCDEMRFTPEQSNQILKGRIYGMVFAAVKQERHGEVARFVNKQLTKRLVQAKLERASEMRKNPTEAERALGEQLRKHFPGAGFGVQRLLLGYIADFYSESLGLVVEVDGSSHIGREDYDAHRDSVLMAHGIKTIRISNRRATNDMAGVLIELGSHIRQARAVKASRAAAEKRRKAKP